MISDSLWATFCGVAERVPDVEAILSPGRQPLRFADLPDRLRGVREDLARLGIGRGDRVAGVLRRGPETAVCCLGVAACATYIPLNPDFSEAEFTSYLTQLRPAAVIVPEGHGSIARACASALGIRAIDLVSRMRDPAGTFSLVSRDAFDAPQRVGSWNTADDVALVLLTSGSSAEPKAVPLKARHLLAYARASGRHFSLTADDRCLHVMPMFHGHGLKSSLLIPLANGSGVIVAPDFDIPLFFQQLHAMRPTWYSAAASIHQAILARIGEYADIARQAKLRFIRTGSSRLDPRLIAELERAFGAPVIELYSMSETGNLTANPLPPGLRKPGSVGRPMGNEVAIIDQHGTLLGPNREGEVVARGPSVFDGYLDRPEANQAAFINGWFRTGDLGRFDDDGYLTLTGRIKDVIIRGGEKIGTGEVEAVLLRHPAVIEACAFGLPHPSLGEDVAVAASTRGDVSEQELLSFARGFLTSVKVPRRVFLLPSLPKGSTNKIQRAETAAVCVDLLEKSHATADRVSSRAWSPLEQEIAGIWKRLLAIDKIDLKDDFFLLGGDSLQAAELFARLQKTYRVTLRLRQVFEEAATVAGMAKLIERVRLEKSKTPPETAGLVTIKADGRWPPLFAVPGVGGNPVGLVHLGRLVDPRQPLIGIESRGIDGAGAALVRMEDIAADNIARIRTIQPRGPYFLTGACFGARVAYEMARQLEAAGEPVGLLLMLAPASPFFSDDGRRRGTPPSGRGTSHRQLLFQFVYNRITRLAVLFVQLRGARRRAFVREKMATLCAMIRHRDVFRGDRSELHRRAVLAANRQAGRHYVPAPFAGPVVLCLSRNRPIRGHRNFRLDWLKLASRIGAPIYVGGQDSGDMLRPPHVYELADIVNKELETVHAKEVAQHETRAVS